MATRPFTITSFAWRKDIEERLAAAGEDTESEEVILASLSALAGFLQSRSLTTRTLTNSEGLVQRDFVLRSDDLTELGLALVRRGYEKWVRTAKSASDVRPLEKVLAKLHEEASKV